MRMDISKHELYTQEELCEKLKITRQTFHKYKKKGLVPPHIEVLGRERYPVTIVNEWLKQNNPLLDMAGPVDESLINVAQIESVFKEE